MPFKTKLIFKKSQKDEIMPVLEKNLFRKKNRITSSTNEWPPFSKKDIFILKILKK